MQNQMFNQENATNLNEVSIPLLTEQIGQYWKFTSFISAEKREAYEQRVFSLVSKFVVQSQAEAEILDPKKDNMFMRNFKHSVDLHNQQFVSGRREAMNPPKNGPEGFGVRWPEKWCSPKQAVFSPYQQMVERTLHSNTIEPSVLAMDSVTCDVLNLVMGLKGVFEHIVNTAIFNDLLKYFIAEHDAVVAVDPSYWDKAKIRKYFFVHDGITIAHFYRGIKQRLADGSFSFLDLSALEEDIVLASLDGYTRFIVDDISIGDHTVIGDTLRIPSAKEREQILDNRRSGRSMSYHDERTLAVLENGQPLPYLKKKVVETINARRIFLAIDDLFTEFVKNFTEVVNDLKNEAAQ